MAAALTTGRAIAAPDGTAEARTAAGGTAADGTAGDGTAADGRSMRGVDSSAGGASGDGVDTSAGGGGMNGAVAGWGGTAGRSTRSGRAATAGAAGTLGVGETAGRAAFTGVGAGLRRASEGTDRRGTLRTVDAGASVRVTGGVVAPAVPTARVGFSARSAVAGTGAVDASAAADVATDDGADDVRCHRGSASAMAASTAAAIARRPSARACWCLTTTVSRAAISETAGEG